MWAVYSFLFCSALEKLPSVAATVFRGLDLPLTQLSHMYFKDSTVWLNAVTSTATDKDTALAQFGTGATGRPGTLLQIIAVDAKDIQAFSQFPESELLIPPNSCHTVQTVLESAEVRRLPSAGIYCCFSWFPVCSLDPARYKRFHSSAACPQELT